MSDFTAKLGLFRGSLPTVARGRDRGVWFRLAELHELNLAAVLNALGANLDFDPTTRQQPRAAFGALRSIADLS